MAFGKGSPAKGIKGGKADSSFVATPATMVAKKGLKKGK